MKLPFRKNKENVDPVLVKKKNRERMLLVLAGVMMGLSFPPFPFPCQIFMFAGLIPLLIVIEKREKLIEINRAVYLFGFIFSLITLYWVGSWQKEADPFLMISGGLLVFVNPVFFMIPSTLYYFSRKIFKSNAAIYLFPVFWITYEYLYMLTDLSFPWLILGGGLSKFLLFIQIADITGTLGLSLLVVYFNVFAFRAFTSPRPSRALYINSLAALIVFAVPLIYGSYIFENYKLSDRKITAGIIQPNIDPWDKWEGGNLNELADLNLDLSRKAISQGAQILFWPETSLPVYLYSGGYPSLTNKINSFLRTENKYLLTGMPHIKMYSPGDSIPSDAKYSAAGEYYYTSYNGILLLGPGQGLLQTYGKMKLVPFGERVPFVDAFPFLGKFIKWGVGISGWNLGKDTTIFKAAVSINDTLKVNGLVCYESIYPYFISEFINKDADMIAILTNDSWYGNSSGPYQHKEYAVLRAVENRKSVIRAANGGISTIIDPLGRTAAETKMFTRTVLTGSVILQPGKSFFTTHSLLVPVTASAISLLIAIVFFLMKLKKFMKI